MQTDGLTTRLPTRRRQMKFTPEKLQQIRELVQRGKRREEIAELIGVTVGSLQVTCSRLGISLRRVVFENGTGLLRPSGSHPNNGTTTTNLNNGTTTHTHTCGVSVPLPPIKEQLQQKAVIPHQGSAKTNDVDRANSALRMQYRGDQRTTERRREPSSAASRFMERCGLRRIMSRFATARSSMKVGGTAS
jgi:hypothetical protein